MHVGMLTMTQYADAAVGRIEQGLARVAGARSERRLPLLRAFEAQGSTADVDFATTKDVWLSDPGRSPVSHVVLDSGWEEKVASVLESLPQVVSYVKNDHLGFAIPYVLDGEQRSYLPDFLVRARTAAGEPPLTVVVEVSGARRRDKDAKVATARNLWVPAVNAHGGYGRWRFVEVTDPYDCRARLVSALGPDALVEA